MSEPLMHRCPSCECEFADVALSRANLELTELRSLQAKEQSSAATHTPGCPALGGYGHGKEPCICGADPPPPEDEDLSQPYPGEIVQTETTYQTGTSSPEDALLAEADARLKGLHGQLKPSDGLHPRPENNDILADIDLLIRLRERIVNDASDLAAAEARAQGMEADARRYRWLQLQFCGREPNHVKAHHEERCYLDLNPADMDAAIDSAALQRPEPEGKERG